ncbi:MAG: DUF3536 domain-containing protein [Anaerolineae bacterium]|nr:DUF3536 domain-containing protein [Anaerolineae bacterium]
MSTRPYQYFCVHGHYRQPPRGNPVTGDIGEEPEAGRRYRNWNERITAEAYRPNAEIGNYDIISFDIGEELMSWLAQNSPETYRRIVEADRVHQARAGVGNALGGPYHHGLLPLRRTRDRLVELYWGRVAFEHHFGRAPQGLWLPEMAVDHETLRVAQTLGYQFTVLSQGQVVDADDAAGPYWVDIGADQPFGVFVRDDELSNDLSFNITAIGGAGHWARNKLARRRAGRLTLVATLGETFGHHHLGEERFLHWLLEHEAPTIGYRVTTLTEYFRENPPARTIDFRPFTSWGDPNSVARWYVGWRGLLWRALDKLSSDYAELMRQVLSPHSIDPWKLRREYIRVRLGQISGEALLAEFAPGLKKNAEEQILALLNGVFALARAYASNAFLVDDFDRKEPRYAIASAAYAVHVAEEASGEKLAQSFRNDLRLIVSDSGALNGQEVYDSVVTEFINPPPPEEEPGETADSQQSAPPTAQEQDSPA